MNTARRRLVALLVSSTLALGVATAVASRSRAQVADTHVDLGELVATSGRAPVVSRWLRVRLVEVVGQLDALCYQPALARRAGLSGELRVRATLGRAGRLTGVAVTRVRGGTLTSALASCVRGAFARARLDLAPLPVAPLDPVERRAYVAEPPQGPPEAGYPVRVALRLELAAPPAAPPVSPEPTPSPRACGPNPAGCVATGCRSGMHCDTTIGCRPSGCGCSPETGAYVCTTDCGGGTCVRD